MPDLSSKQRSYLKSKAHSLKPILQIGREAITAQSVASINKLFDSHELVKIKFIAHKEEKQVLVDELMPQIDASFVSLIGHVLTLYKAHQDPEKRHIRLPA